MDMSQKHNGFMHVALEVTDLEEGSINCVITEGPIVTPLGSFIFIHDLMTM
jgi:hypothetical protein